jgi:transposase InsO family protein
VSVDESDLRWCSDGFEISCWNKEKVRVAFALDCCDREAISWLGTTKGIDAGLVKDMMPAAVEQRFGSDATPPRPIEWLTYNGSCYTARETRAFARAINMRPLTTPVESPNVVTRRSVMSARWSSNQCNMLKLIGVNETGYSPGRDTRCQSVQYPLGGPAGRRRMDHGLQRVPTPRVLGMHTTNGVPAQGF